jgi:BirA family biotin operon repressor/biotin-[acetyl-CoA-carboxylase] ligase
VISLPKELRFEIHHHDVLESTMDTARKMAEEGCNEGTVVVAREQSKGRGRGGRTWRSPRGGLYLSVVLRPDIASDESHKLVYLAGNAAAVGLAHLTGERINLKWPNDLHHNELKVGGILCESSSMGKDLRFAILGIGINTDLRGLPAELKDKATSVLRITDRDVDNDKVTKVILNELSARYKNFPENFGELLDEWRELTTTFDRDVILDGKMVRALDVDDDGALLVNDGGKQRRVVSGTLVYP